MDLTEEQKRILANVRARQGLSPDEPMAPVFMSETPPIRDASDLNPERQTAEQQAALQSLRDRQRRQSMDPEMIRYSEEVQRAKRDVPEISMTGVESIMTPGTEGQAKGALAAAVGVTTFDPWEFGQVLMQQDPNIGVVQTPEGEFLAINKQTNKMVSLNRPGLTPIDVMQMIGAVTSLAPSARGATIASRALGAAATQTGIQTAQEMTGGQFNPLDVGMEAAGTYVSDVIPMAARNLRNRFRPVEGSTPTGVTISEAAVAQQPSRMQRAAEAVDVDPQTLAAAERLGVDPENVPLGALSMNQDYITLEANLRGRPGSLLDSQAAETTLELSRNIANRFKNYDAALSRGEFDEVLRTQINDDIASLAEQSNDLYKGIKNALNRFGGPNQIIDTPVLASYADNMLKRYRGQKIPTGLKNMLDIITDPENVTYSQLDDLRRTIGEQYAQALRGSNPFPDTNTRMYAQMYDVITNQQNRALQSITPRGSQIWQSAKSLVNQRKQLENVSVELLGKDLTKDIMPGLESATFALSRGNIRNFTKKIEAIPENLRSQAMLMALKGIMQRNAKSLDVDQEFVPNFASFPEWWRNVKSDPAIMKLLNQYLAPSQVQFMDDVGRLGGSLKRVQQRMPMNGRVVDFIANFEQSGGFIGRLFGDPTGVIGRTGNAVFTALTDPMYTSRSNLANKTSDLLRDPRFKRMTINIAQGKPADTLANQLIRRTSFKEWFDTMPPSIQSGIRALGAAELPNASPDRVLATGLVSYFSRSNFDEIEQYFTGEE